VNPEEPVPQAERTYVGNTYASCKTCGELASWVPSRLDTEWECYACRTGTRHFGRADREEYLRATSDEMRWDRRRKLAIKIAVAAIAFVIGAMVTMKMLF
jgi:hypothetical protein